MTQPLTLSDLVVGQSLTGIDPDAVVSLVAVTQVAEGAVQVVYLRPDGTPKVRLLTQPDLVGIRPATTERPWAFDGDAASFQLACEAKRIDLAFLFDPMMAVHTSNVEPLPHQITAVYEAMLPRQPLRYVLADDPGAGKTIMAGLYIRELVMRADAHRILIVSPGSLVEQWRDEMNEKFGLEFRIYSPGLIEASPSGNPFSDYNYLIIRLDQISRDEAEQNGKKIAGDMQSKLLHAGWDLVIFDEAHKLSAHYFGNNLTTTARYRFAERIGAHTRHLLLMTATPHNGKDEDFQLFLALLDNDRFYGKPGHDASHKVDASDLMRRMIKEELVKFDGTPLFPERKAYTVNYTLSEHEAALYAAVTDYVRTEMGKADQLGDNRKGSVGFALTALQRRLASSPEAIFQSLKRRRERLEKRIREESLLTRGRLSMPDTFTVEIPEDDEDLNADEQETLEENLVDRATAAQTITELQTEVAILGELELQAKAVVASGQDRKWDELSKILQNNPELKDANNKLRKIIIFTEHRDTLNYLLHRIAGVLGNDNSIVTIHGGTHRDERRKSQALFRSDPDIRVLIATDAAGEGVNLQNANLMVNYDLPWNPNRLEQRFGRIHRIGQTEVCHLWNLVAKETREGEVYHRLLQKLEVESKALNGRVFDILGEVFEETSLKQLLMDAIRYGDQPEVRARLSTKIDNALDHAHLTTLLDRNALASESMTAERLFGVKEEMEKAEARRLQPFFVRSFFLKAFESLGGTIYQREGGRFEITFVPEAIRERDRRITGRNRREQEPVLKRYDRICFEKTAVQPLDKSGLTRAVLMHPGHPLMLSVADIILEQHTNLLRRGSVLLDPSDPGEEPSLLVLLTHHITDGSERVLSRRMQFVRVNPQGQATFAGWAPHLDLKPLNEEQRASISDLLSAPWLNAGLEQRAMGLAAANLVPQHFNEIAERRIAHIEKTLTAVNRRLGSEINWWTDRWMKLKDDFAAGKDVRMPVENARRMVTDLEGRLESRKKQLQSQRHLVNGSPIVLGAALVIPAGLMAAHNATTTSPTTYTADAAARSRIEKLAMNAVRQIEEARGWRIQDVSAEKCGWDLTSYPPEGLKAQPKHIEVKGRVQGADTITVTRNEICYGANQADKFILAVVSIGENDAIDGPYYLRNPFDREPQWGVSTMQMQISEILKRAEKQ